MGALALRVAEEGVSMLYKALLVSLVTLLPCVVHAAELPSYPFIHVSGSGEVRVRPDLGQVDFEIVATGADPVLALQIVSTRVAEIRTLMAASGIPADDLEIRDMRQEIKKGDSAIAVYDVRCGVKIVVRDLTKWKTLLSPLLGTPNLDGFVTSFDTTERPRVESELMKEAIGAARRKGETIAAGFGRKLGPVGGVSTGELKNLTRSMNLTPSEFSQRGRGPEALPREDLLMVNLIKLAQGVDVIFRIK